MLEEALKKWFGFDSFKEGQKPIIENVLNHQHTLGILPTGSGKSLCYQLPTYIKQKPTLIISPLISLMDDQVMQMRKNGERSVSYIHSGMSYEEKMKNLKQLKSSKFIFLSPEFILHQDNIKWIDSIDLGMIVLDEAHCITEWGYDFRPHYALIGRITKKFPKATLLALTATAPLHLQEDIEDIVQTKLKVVKTKMSRDNIMLSHLNFENNAEKNEWLKSFIEHSGPTIIYVSSKKKCRELAQMIYDEGYLTGIYHGDLSYQERQTVQQQFIQNKIPMIVATSAFGMGINKPDIRTVIHYHLPVSPSSYLQEIGRAGRDGQLSQAISLYQPDDYFLLETILFADIITEADIDAFDQGANLPEQKAEILDVLATQYTIEQIKMIFSISGQRKKEGLLTMMGYKNLTTCRRHYLMSYFGETITPTEKCCDNDNTIQPINVLNKKKVARKMDYLEKLNQIFT
ncbi:ATP-dependent DNA helicase RecQ [Staphylococcus sp. HMSC061G12]|uniref:RecQ family ATP-dependent DNA helicase n=1 Tax=Staphylococcus sp. HMSC061G12 TaxID=1739441 RepID=UPI0008A846C4|nr:RecQ family ATP-dependent DNA helicase [Staphylococcus sp. HMSC061G12]OHR61458.1 recombinase RecQ [Staphylococcus sp. HMSC061G12]